MQFNEIVLYVNKRHVVKRAVLRQLLFKILWAKGNFLNGSNFYVSVNVFFNIYLAVEHMLGVGGYSSYTGRVIPKTLKNGSSGLTSLALRIVGLTLQLTGRKFWEFVGIGLTYKQTKCIKIFWCFQKPIRLTFSPFSNNGLLITLVLYREMNTCSCSCKF